MPTVAITGRITDASGTGVEYAVARLSPAPSSSGSAQAVGGIGVIAKPVEAITDSAGDFSINAVTGFRYRLTIQAIGYDRIFECPAAGTTFDLLGLSPTVESVANGEDADADVQVFVSVKVDSAATVRERFDQLSLESATALAGPYVELENWDLLAGKTFYEYQDNPSDNAVFYRARYILSSGGPDYSQYSDIKSAAEADDQELVISVEELIEHYLFGADLTDDDGNPYPRSMFIAYIKSAVAWMEKQLDIPIVAINRVQERHDHYGRDYGSWGYFQTSKYPVIEVTALAFQYPSMESAVEINLEWVIIEDEGRSGVIQVVPGRGSIADVLLIPGALMPHWSGPSGRVPGVWMISYRAGFEVGEIEDDIKDIIAKKAAIGPLNIAGDLIAGAGIATKSVTLPGLSQNIGTTSSATNSGYGARIGQYEKEIKAAIPNLKAYYGKGTKMEVV